MILLFHYTIKRAASPLEVLCSPRKRSKRKTEKTNKSSKESGTGPKARGRGRNAALEAMRERKAIINFLKYYLLN